MTATFFSSRPFRLLRRRNIFPFLLALNGALLLGGCRKPEPVNQAVTAMPAANTNQNSAPVPSSSQIPTTALAIAAAPAGGADLRQLNHVYMRWIAQNRRRPSSYENFIELSGIQVPPAPAGKKYVIDKNGFIALSRQ